MAWPPARNEDDDDDEMRRKKEEEEEEEEDVRVRRRGERERGGGGGGGGRSSREDERGRGRGERERERDRRRRRSRSRERRRRSRSRERDGDRDRDRDRRRRRSRSRERRPRSRSRERRARSNERGETAEEARRRETERINRQRAREEAALDRDLRTVLVSNLSSRAHERDIYEFFTDGGLEVTDVQLIRDRKTREPKGFAYVELAEKAQVPAAVQLAGGKLFGQEVHVKSSEAEKNAAWEVKRGGDKHKLGSLTQTMLPPPPPVTVSPAKPVQGTTGALRPPPPMPPPSSMAKTTMIRPVLPLIGGPAELVVRNLHPALKKEDLRSVCEPFGVVDSVQVQVTEDSSSNTALVKYANGLAAVYALQQLNGLNLAGKILEASPAEDGQGEDPQKQQQQQHFNGGQVQNAGPPPPWAMTYPPSGLIPPSVPSSSTLFAPAIDIPQSLSILPPPPLPPPPPAELAQPGQAVATAGGGGALNAVPMAVSGAVASFMPPPLQPVDTTSMPLSGGIDVRTNGVGELDEGPRGLKLNAQSRAALMARLSESNGAGLTAPKSLLGSASLAAAAAAAANATKVTQPLSSSIPQASVLPVQGVLGPASPIPTSCLLLKNLFDPAEEEHDDWDQDIQAETKDECAKFGPVEHIAVDKDSQGFVYIKFATVTAATAAQKALNNRFFGGRTVSTEFQFEKVYTHHFMK